MKNQEEALKHILREIEQTPPQSIETPEFPFAFQLRWNTFLQSDLSGNLGAFFVRSFLKQLNLDEHFLLRWRMENKYRQYQIFHHYVPGIMAETYGLKNLLAKENGVEQVWELCRNGFFVKATLGHQTGADEGFDRSSELPEILARSEKGGDLENWMLQKRMNFIGEYRIHSFGRDIVPGLTFVTGERKQIEPLVLRFLENTMMHLPDSILNAHLIGWDIGITDDEEYLIIEANITGYHPEFHRGFQTSGFFGDSSYGAVVCAQLNAYFKQKYHIYIDSVDQKLLSSDSFFAELLFYLTLFNKQYLQVLKDEIATVQQMGFSRQGISILLHKLSEYIWITDFYELLEQK